MNLRWIRMISTWISMNSAWIHHESSWIIMNQHEAAWISMNSAWISMHSTWISMNLHEFDMKQHELSMNSAWMHHESAWIQHESAIIGAWISMKLRLSTTSGRRSNPRRNRPNVRPKGSAIFYVVFIVFCDQSIARSINRAYFGRLIALNNYDKSF